MSALGRSLLISVPSTVMEPEVSVSIPPRMLRTVVFPAPEGPTIITNCPLSMSRVTPSQAFIVLSPTLYVFTTSLREI